MPGRYGVRSLFSFMFPNTFSDPIEEFMDQRAVYLRTTDKVGTREESLSAVGPYLGAALEMQRKRLISRKLRLEISEWPDRNEHPQWYAHDMGGEQVYHVRFFSTDTRNYCFLNLNRCSIRDELWHDYYLLKKGEEEYIISSMDVADKADCYYKRNTEYCSQEDLESKLKLGLLLRKKQKESRIVSRNIADTIRRKFPEFSLEQFIAQASGRLKCIYYADNQAAVETFVNGDLGDFIKNHQNVVNCELMDFHFMNFYSDAQKDTISAKLVVILDRDEGSYRIKRKTETIKVWFERPVEGIMNQDWYVAGIEI